jgi:hypothetical protein
MKRATDKTTSRHGQWSTVYGVLVRPPGGWRLLSKPWKKTWIWRKTIKGRMFEGTYFCLHFFVGKSQGLKQLIVDNRPPIKYLLTGSRHSLRNGIDLCITIVHETSVVF